MILNFFKVIEKVKIWGAKVVVFSQKTNQVVGFLIPPKKQQALFISLKRW